MAAIPTLSSSSPPISLQASPSSASSKPNHLLLPSTLTLTSLFGTRIAIQTSSSYRFFSHGKYCRAASANVSLSLPSTRPPATTPENLPKWSARAIKSFATAELEARKLKYPETGTDALLLGILAEGTSKAAKFLRANGITLLRLREEIVELLGKSDVFFAPLEHPPLTEQAQKAIDWAVEEKLKSGEGGEITVGYLLLGIWSQKESAGHRILAAHGFNDEKAKEVATSTLSKISVICYVAPTRHNFQFQRIQYVSGTTCCRHGKIKNRKGQLRRIWSKWHFCKFFKKFGHSSAAIFGNKLP